MQDVERTFKEFLAGNIVAHPRDMSGAEMVRSKASISSQKSRMEKGTRCVCFYYFVPCIDKGAFNAYIWSIEILPVVEKLLHTMF